MTDAAATDLLHRRMRALCESDLPLREWDAQFVDSVCYRSTCATTPRQQQMVEILCWRYRDHLPADLVPDRQPAELKAPR